MSWSAIEDGLREWVKSATGLGDTKVIWLDQTGQRPATPFAELKLSAIVPVGCVDELDQSTNLGNAPGQEIEQTVIGTRRFRCTVQIYSDPVTGDSDALALAGKCQTALRLPSVRDALKAAGATVFDLGQAMNVTVRNGTKYEGRGLLDVGLYMLDTVQEKTGYIDTVDLSQSNYLGPPNLGTKDNIDI